MIGSIDFINQINGSPRGCWLWRLRLNNHGYGPHRRMYERFVGPIPKGYDLDHTCRVRSCINPAHLEPVTRFENLRRGDGCWMVLQTEKTHCKRGHLLSGDNLYVRKSGFRNCRKCHCESEKQRYRDRKGGQLR